MLNYVESCLLLSSAGLLSGIAIASPSIPVKRDDIAAISKDGLDKDYAAERAHRPADRKQPIIGLSLSGGGTKAAMFAHGVLHGLQNKKVLEKIDAISSVSGGSYAAYWYFSKAIEAQHGEFSLAQIFDDCIPRYWVEEGAGKAYKVVIDKAVAQGRLTTPRVEKCKDNNHFDDNDPYRWQAHLVRWPDVMQERPIAITGSEQPNQKRVIVKGLASSLIKALRTPGPVQEAMVPRLYQYGIERTWGLSPLPRTKATLSQKNENAKWNYSNVGEAPDAYGVRRVDPTQENWTELRKLYVANHSQQPSLPLWIVNSNVDNKTNNAARNVRHIFEMTPFGFGAQGPEGAPIGYINDIADAPFLDLGTAVRASAGFADAQGVESERWRKALGVATKLMPGLQWGVDANIRSADGKVTERRLSDGGGGENLGLYSLLKRGLEDVVVVDTASDVEGNMSDVCALKAALHEDGISLDFPALFELPKVCEPKSKLRYNMSAWMNPVVLGTVRWPDGKRTARIFLVKAAWKQEAVGRAFTKGECGATDEPSCFLAVFYGHNRSVVLKKQHTVMQGKVPTLQTIKTEDMHFPQLSTTATTLNSSSYLFWGFRELGRDAVKNLSYDPVTGRLQLNATQCLQKALAHRPGLRPRETGDGMTCYPIPLDENSAEGVSAAAQ